MGYFEGKCFGMFRRKRRTIQCLAGEKTDQEYNGANQHWANQPFQKKDKKIKKVKLLNRKIEIENEVTENEIKNEIYVKTKYWHEC